MSSLRVVSVTVVGLAVTALPVRAQGPTAADYAAASRLIERNLFGLVKNETIEPHWIDGGSFWYRRDEGDGARYVRFDRKTGKRTPLFDHEAVAAAIGKTGAVTPAPAADRLRLAGVEISADLTTLTGVAGAKKVTCRLAPATCEASPVVAADVTLPAPAGGRAILVRDYNLVLKDSATGRETPLTTDGQQYFAWASLTDASLITIPRRRGFIKPPPMGASWSPDGRYLIASQTDERKVPVNPFVEWVPMDGSLRPIYHEIRSVFTGDSIRLTGQTRVFDVTTGRSVAITLPEKYATSIGTPLPEPVGWSAARRQAFFVGRTAGSKTAVMFRVDLTTGEASVVLEESSPTRVELNTEEYNQPNVRVIGDGKELIWYSARSGSGQLYRYDAQTGALLNPITTAPGAVFNVIAIDEKRREIYYTAGGREPGRDPYLTHLYKANLDKGGARLLTPDDGEHEFPPAASSYIKLLFRRPDPPPRIDLEGQVFVDTWSTVGTPAVTVLRSTVDGKLLFEIERADPAALLATGYRPPVREKVKAADGTTDLWAVYREPALGTLGQASHPIVDAVYGGPQVIVAPRSYRDAYSGGNPLADASLTRLGFAVVTVDGRGTPYRDNAFRDAGYTEFTQVAIDDHIAVIRQLAAKHPEIDTTRVGIYGWSWGGTFTGQALLSRPDFYKVGVSGAGVYNYAALYQGFENFTGVPEYASGSRVRTKPSEQPSNWKKLDITAMAPNLKGHLLLIYGDLDENVPSSQVFRMVDALVKANKPYDLLYLPGRTHAGGLEGYPIQRTWDYFVEHLGGVTPPRDAVVTFVAPR